MRTSLFSSLVGTAILAVLATPVVAAEPADSTGPADSSESTPESTPESIIVSATRLPTPELEVASSVTVVTAEEIAARQERSLTDVLKDVPGLNVVRTGGPGGTAAVFMRGTNSNHTKVLVDGIDVSDPSSSTAT
jgi:vitamin B12 transporter